jgi:hypothetical protein
MKTVVLALFALSLASGCAPSEISQPLNPIKPRSGNAASAPPQLERVEEQLMPTQVRTRSDQFYLEVRFSSEDSKESEGSSPRYLKAAPWPQIGYRTMSSIYIGSLPPAKIEVSFPLPPEVETSGQTKPVLLLGCQFEGVGDVYFMEAATKELHFETLHAMPRGHLTSVDRIAAAFRVCENQPVAMSIKFMTPSGEQAITSEQTHIYSDKTTPPSNQ